MYYVKETTKPYELAAAALERAVKENGFGVLHVHDIGNTLRNKGVAFAEQCRVFEVCNPIQAGKVLATDMRLNMALPCRISVYTEQGKTLIGMIKPQQILELLSQDPTLAQVAREVEATTTRIINDAAG